MPDRLTLSIDAFSTTLIEFEQGGYECLFQENGDTEYSLFGASLDSGSLYEPKRIWTIAAMATKPIKQALEQIWRRSERKRIAQQDYRITCEDWIFPHTEDQTPRTRALATGAAVTNLSGGGIEYPAKFYVRLFEPNFQRTNSGRYPYNCRFVLKELDPVPA